MSQLGLYYQAAKFDVISCFGNSLVYLDNDDEILELFKQIRILLKPNGVFLFQILNFDKIINDKIEQLPTIHSDYIKFQRFYQYNKEVNKIQFTSYLHDKKFGTMLKNTVKLYPLRAKRVNELLQLAGFKQIEFYGSFSKDEFTANSPELLANVY